MAGRTSGNKSKAVANKLKKASGSKPKAAGSKPGSARSEAVGRVEPEAEVPAEPGELDSYNLVALEAELGAMAEPEILNYVAGYDRKALIEKGVQVASSRIITDCTRDYGRAASFLRRATPEQRRLLSEGISRLVRAGVSAARRCQAVERELISGKTASAAKQLEARKAFKAMMERGRAERQLMHVRARMVVAGEGRLVSALQQAFGTAATAGELATSLRDLVKFCQRLARSKDEGLVQRLAESDLDAERLAETMALAGEVEQAGAEADSVQTAPPVSQADLDYWDGINLVLYGLIKDYFEAARVLDPAIPRLAPMALRSYFGRPARRRKPSDSADSDADGDDGAE